MDQVYERQTLEVDEYHWWYRGRREVITQMLRRLDLGSAPRILDAGCGSGRNMVDLARLGTVTGIELADASAARARERGVGEVVQGSLEKLPFEDGQFDLAVCFDVIEHLDDDRAALRELRRVVRPGGALLLTVPTYQWLWSEHDVINHHKRRYTSTTLAVPARDAGWDVETSTYFNGLLLPVAVAYRLLSRLRPQSDQPVSDLGRTPALLNKVLEKPLRLEARMVARGTRIPAGLSLMAVLR